MGDLPGGGGAVEVKHMASHSTPLAEPNRLEIVAENWAAADRAAREIIRKVQPTPVSEERRKEVVGYIQRLIRDCLGAEVFPYGSVPLKTYLPDGDIDLTAFGGANVEDTLADEMKSVLEEEERNTAAEFVVKDVQLIRAEVDRLIGRDHLFKCSIILIKAWCYYESRILGAHHGLISTYALETLVLYIFHFYNSTLDGPLMVLYKFLDYFSKFDWDTYCVSLQGPLRLSSLPAIDVEIPEGSDKNLLLSNDFLNTCVGMFSVPSRVGDRNPHVFQRKNLNIVDPLKEINNLGRSVNKGNFFRIRSAFSYGARKLVRILQQPQDSISDELKKFFANTMARHGIGQRPDVQDFDKSLVNTGPASIAPFLEAGFCRTDSFYEDLDEYSVSTADRHSNLGSLTEDLSQSDIENREQYSSSVLEGLKISTLSETGKGGVSIVGSCYENVLVDRDDAMTSIKLGETFGDQKSFSFSGDSNHTDTDHGQANRNGSAETVNSSSELTGDYERCIQHLHYGRWCYEYSLGMNSLLVPSLPPTSPYSWDGLFPLLPYKQNGFAHPYNGFHPNPAIYGMQPVLLPPVPFVWEDVPKHRGTGTYLPNTIVSQHGNRSPAMKVNNQAPSRSPRHNGRSIMTFQEPNMLDRSSHELPQPVDKTVVACSSDSHLAFPHQKGQPHANGSSIQHEVELVGHASVSENSRPQRTVSSSPRTGSGLQRPQTAPGKEKERISLRSSYRLKDEDDFPPLST